MVFTTALHGNEPIPVYALASLGVDQVICNTQALVLGKRFIEKDLNHSFGTNGNSLEEKRAQELLKIIPESETVVDLHSMSAISDPFAIIIDPKMIPLAATTGLKHVVLMSHNIKSGHSLIDHRRGISIEVGLHQDPQTYNFTKTIYQNIKAGKSHPFTLYEVYGVIEKEGEYQNFTMHKDGFIPVLAGEKAYNIPGLKSKIITT